MHLAVLCEYPSLHGGERSLLAAIDELCQRQADWKFTFLAPPAGPLAGALSARNLGQVSWPIRTAAGERLPNDIQETSLMEHLGRIAPDLVHANSLAMGRMLGRIADRLLPPATAHLRDIIGLSAAAITDLNRLDRLFAVSDATRIFHVAQGLDASNTVVIHNGIDLQLFRPRPATGWLKRELNLPADARLLATIGQIGLRKGWDVLAVAAEDIARQHPNVHFLMIGARHSDKPESRDYEATIRQRFAEPPLAGRAHWLGERNDVDRLLNEIDLLVHPALQEPLGRVLLEALACGVPIVATDVGGTREILEPELSGRLVPPRDPMALANAVNELLKDRELALRFREAARARAEASFEIQASALALAEGWRSVRKTPNEAPGKKS
ncbi:MAG: glycosyltransferase family 4 protein [Planctomycetaceae bacterium]